MIFNALTLHLAQRSYPVYIGHAIYTRCEIWQSLIAGSQICIVTDARLAPLYLSQFTPVFSRYLCSNVILPDGEVHKKFEVWVQIIDALVADNHARSTTLIALGGGVIGDMTGFAAACYHRGVALIQVPTTLLAQVDAAIGGKNAINYRQMKNLLGFFYQPRAVIIDTAFLSTLPQREFQAGLAEVIKYALIQDKDFFDYLSENMNEILVRSPSVLAYVLEVCCRIKIYFVEKDENDLRGLRAVLNFGHTFGHALENVTRYVQVLHGEAVAWGMLKACQLSQRLGYLSLKDVEKVEALLNRCSLLIPLPSGVTVDLLLNAMQCDKKNLTGRITLVLLQQLGQAFVTDAVATSSIRELLQNESALR